MESAPPAMKVEDTNTKGQLPSCELTVGACQPVACVLDCCASNNG